MTLENEFKGRGEAGKHAAIHEVEMDPILADALSHFRGSVHAWSEAAYLRPRLSAATGRRAFAWQKLAAGVLSMVLVGAAAATGVHEYRHQQEVARLAAARAAEQKREIAAEQAREAEDLMAKIDKDVSQQVPSAMEPLASLMTEDDSQ